MRNLAALQLKEAFAESMPQPYARRVPQKMKIATLLEKAARLDSDASESLFRVQEPIARLLLPCNARIQPGRRRNVFHDCFSLFFTNEAMKVHESVFVIPLF